MKKCLLAILILFLTIPPALAQFKDLKPGHPAYPFVSKLVREGIIEVAKNKRFEAGGNVNKYQLAVILDRVYALAYPDKPPPPPTVVYKDVPSTSYANEAAGRLSALKVFEPDANGNFNGGLRLTRYYFYYTLCRFIESSLGRQLPAVSNELGYSNISESDPYYPYLQKLIGAGLLPGGKLRFFDGELMLNRMEMSIFIANVLDYLRPEKKPGEVTQPAVPKSGFIDIPEDHYARESIDELVDVGILPKSPGQKFNGTSQINKFELLNLLSKVLEKLLIGEEGELDLADAALSYKDVGTSNPAYRSVQKLIALSVLPPGNRTEILNGELPITRYQLAYYLLNPIENILMSQVKMQEASPEAGYRDVSKDNFAYSAIQKLIWLGVLPGGRDKEFRSDSFAVRYDLAYYSVRTLKALYLKIKEEEILITPPPDYGFRTYLNTSFNYSTVANGKSPGTDLKNIFGLQSLNLTVNRRLSNSFSSYIYLQNNLYFGSTSPQYLNIGEAYLSYNNPSFSLKAGRIYNYYGWSPFGASLFFDNTVDQATYSIDSPLCSLNAAAGKLSFKQDVSTDSNFASLYLISFDAPLQISAGGNLVTNIFDPTMTAQLPSRVTQTYAGAKLKIFGQFEANAEASKVDYSNQDVLQYIGTSGNIDTNAFQDSLTYFSPNLGFNLSLGYQRLGEYFYNGGLSDPGYAVYSGMGKEASMLKLRFDLTPERTLLFNTSSLYRCGAYLGNVVFGNYTQNLSRSTYLNLSVKHFADNSEAQNSTTAVSGSVSLSF